MAFNGFFIPNHLLSGGVGGIAIMAHYLTNIHTGLIIFIINVPIFIIGAKFIDKEFIIYSFVSMFTMSVLLSVTEGIDQYIKTNDMLLEAIFGGALNGLGMGIMFRNRASQGGVDIIAAVAKKKFNVNLGTALMGVNLLIIGLSSVLFGLKPAMYTIIGLYIGYQIVDKIQCGLDTKKTVIIISDKSQQLADEIIVKLKRGATLIDGQGAYSKNNKKLIYCTIMSSQLAKLKELVEEIDPDAFITVNDAQEVKGKGFKHVGI
ncbi:hypothetical protein, YitT family [Caldisalinibacter kiritimatiensis]|uniref:DUF2179 domain-containing protein n=1 Tax=Caldisalinibacter kiritimatiensis TaxID=1304284 RepID=R1AXG5_9FIRM|nr:hypothetical protein, YitT family [Caldisalinibacter kiritimatiensis]